MMLDFQWPCCMFDGSKANVLCNLFQALFLQKNHEGVLLFVFFKRLFEILLKGSPIPGGWQGQWLHHFCRFGPARGHILDVCPFCM